ncbi:PREDICTED: probable G-protein coupled receptor 173 [Priapulus caudatus]|uniref:Probable G-protein coupled receptor 173 n=1 Tax=Priapulus caudatus TaxID=37621 RepID=A0ABM1F158_PRICU|nr:PREDICTED: probable G-protein coupled receptor 173 [Priapulus caudatus]
MADSDPHPGDDSATAATDPPLLLKTVCLGIIVGLSTSANVVAMLVLLRARRLRSAPYCYLLNLTLTDLLRTVFCHAFVLGARVRAFSLPRGATADRVCKLVAFVNVLLTFNCVFTLLVLAIDRYLATVYARFHARKIRGLICLAVALLSWGLAFMMAFPPVFGLGAYRYAPDGGQCTFQQRVYRMNDTLGFTLIFSVAVGVTSAVYARIFARMRGRRRMRPVVRPPAVSDSWTFFGAGAGAVGGATCVPTRATERRPGEGGGGRGGGAEGGGEGGGGDGARSTRMCVFLHAAFVVLWLPYLVMAYWHMLRESATVPTWYLGVATWCTYLYVVVNPIVYVASSATFRRALRRTITCSRRRERPYAAAAAAAGDTSQDGECLEAAGPCLRAETGLVSET